MPKNIVGSPSSFTLAIYQLGLSVDWKYWDIQQNQHMQANAWKGAPTLLFLKSLGIFYQLDYIKRLLRSDDKP